MLNCVEQVDHVLNGSLLDANTKDGIALRLLDTVFTNLYNTSHLESANSETYPLIIP